MQTTVRELQRELSKHPVKLELPNEPMLVKVDFSLTQHALANLLVNAATHTPPGTPIEAQARFADNNLVLSVGDRGRGLPRNICRGFSKNFFADQTPLPAEADSGLTIAKGFVEAQGGTITAANRHGRGTLFR